MKIGYTFVVDVGKFSYGSGVLGTKVVNHWRLTTRIQTTADEVLNRIAGLLRFLVARDQITHVGLSTVFPLTNVLGSEP